MAEYITSTVSNFATSFGEVENITSGNFTISDISSNVKEELLPAWFNVFYFILRLIQGFISLSANLLTILAIIIFPELRNSCTNYFVASLATADALSGLLVFIQIGTIYIFNPSTQAWINACYFELFLNLTSTFGNLYGMLVISIDRFIYIQWPLKYYNIVTLKRSLIAIACMWVFICIKILLSLGFGSQLEIGMPCRWSLVLIFDLYKYLMQTQFYVITAILVLVYVLIGLLVMKLNRQIRQLEPEQATSRTKAEGKQMKKERKTIKVMAMVLGVYMVCYLPTVIYHLIMATKTQTRAIVLGSRWMNYLMWMNNLANPFIYAWKVSEYRRAFKKLLHLQHMEVTQLHQRPKEIA